jgi:hypothetical protein
LVGIKPHGLAHGRQPYIILSLSFLNPSWQCFQVE